MTFYFYFRNMDNHDDLKKIGAMAYIFDDKHAGIQYFNGIDHAMEYLGYELDHIELRDCLTQEIKTLTYDEFYDSHVSLPHSTYKREQLTLF